MSNYSGVNLTPDPPFQGLAGVEDKTGLLRSAYGCFPSGVVAVSGLSEGKPVSMVASSFVGVSIEPALVAFCVQWSSNTWEVLKGLPRIGISVLGEGHDQNVRRLASRAEDKFDQLGLSVSEEGAVFIDGATAWLDCTLHSVLPAGDHGIVLLEIEALTLRPEAEPLIFHGSRFRALQERPKAER
ncbi:flavin reductase family protein [Leisingera thetidis]|uniref:flavin reductase family protein n=1 Tax=Leisingera thetidis TaxID=2930199 RepID=UPI0021F788EB|nr:flavin reductase family protein [Leisingera thetidis]